MIRFVLALTLCLGATACAPSQSAEVGERAESDLSPLLFAVGLHRIEEVYLEALDFDALTVKALEGLQTLDEGFGAEMEGSELVLRSGEAEVARLPTASADDATAWAALSYSAMAAARQSSPALASATSEALYEAYFDAVTAQLDPYSRYLSAAESEAEVASRDGYGGVGLVIEMSDDDRVVVREVFEEGPAARAGLEAGDVIQAIDEQPVEGLQLPDVARRLRGPVDTEVKVEVLRGEQTEVATVTRERVIQNTVETRLIGDIASLRIQRFNSATVRFFREGIEKIEEELGGPPAGVILDLRGNPGGLLDQSITVADLFIRRGDIIATRGRHPQSQQRYTAHRPDIWTDVPMVVLVDDRSASGAEVLAAALQDSGRAVVVGSSSFGKGSVQTVTTLPNSGELFLTWSLIYAPSGYSFHDQGILPNLCTSGPSADPGEIVRLFRGGSLGMPSDAASLRQRARDEPQALERVQSVCPWTEHDPGLDVDVAVSLLGDPQLFAYAIDSAQYITAQRP